MTPDETSRDLDHLEAEVARLKTVLAGMGSRAVPQQPRLGLIKMWAAGMNIRNGKVKTPRRKKKPPINGYASALMGFDFADAETLRLARREFAQYLERNGMDRETAEAEAAELNRSWEFATYAFCPTGEGGGIDNSCSPTGETGISERGSKSLLPESHAETNAWIDIRAKDRSISRNEFLTTDEYKAAYPYLQQLYRAEKLKTAATAVKAMAEVKVNFEDRVGYDYVTPFGVEPYTGEIISRNGIPYIKLDEGQTTIKGTRSVRWHKGWKKLSSGKSFMLRYMSPWRGLMDLRPGSPHLRIFGKYAELREQRRYTKKEFTCAYCGIRRYHLPGEHDQCDHSPTGQCEDGSKQDRGVSGERTDSFKGKGWITSLNDYEYKNVKGWTQDKEWMILNRTLRHGKLTAVEEIRAKQLDSAVSKSIALKTVTTYRGMFIPGKVGAMKVGAVFRDKGFTATSLSEKLATGFIAGSGKGTHVLMEVTVPKGAPAAYLANFPGTKYKNEKEVLLPRGSKFKIKSVKPLSPDLPNSYRVNVILVR